MLKFRFVVAESARTLFKIFQFCRMVVNLFHSSFDGLIKQKSIQNDLSSTIVSSSDQKTAEVSLYFYQNSTRTRKQVEKILTTVHPF